MKYIIKYLFIIICSNNLSSQNKALDSLINKVEFGNSKVIILKNNTVYSISTPLKKTSKINDSIIQLKFIDKNKIEITKKEFWGIITDFSERRRYYNNTEYIIWRTIEPYIYIDLKKRNSKQYLFSETLTSKIYKLDNLAIDSLVTDSVNKRVLKTFIKNNTYDVVQKYKYVSDKYDKVDIGALIETTAELLNDFLPHKPSKSSEKLKRKVLNDPKYK
jgi:hypothetical protein